MLLEQFLRLVRAVKRLSVRVLAGARVVATNNKMRDPVVLADQRVPDGFARSAHAHSQGQQGQFHRPRRIFREQQLIAAHAREVIHVARLRHSD